MDDQLTQFFRIARSIGLDDAERAEMRNGLTKFLKQDFVSGRVDLRQQESMKKHVKRQATHEVHGLQSHEKTAVRDRLHAYMRQTPIREQEPLERASVVLLSFFNSFLPRLALSAFVLFVLGGGAAYAAQGTLPGDALYPVKVNVYEPVVSWFAVTADAQAAWDSDLALRRLEEAEQLAAQSALTEDALTDIEKRFEKHVDTARATIEELADDDARMAAELGAELESHLQAHGTIIGMLDEDGDPENGVSRLLVNVEEAGSSIAVVRSRAETQTGIADDEETLRASVRRRMDHSLERVRMLRDNIEGINGASERSLERLNEAEHLLLQASERLEQGSASEALELSRSAIRVTHEGKLLFSVGEEASSSGDASTGSGQSLETAASSAPAVITIPEEDDDEETDDDDENADADDEDENDEDRANELEIDADIDIDLPF